MLLTLRVTEEMNAYSPCDWTPRSVGNQPVHYEIGGRYHRITAVGVAHADFGLLTEGFCAGFRAVAAGDQLRSDVRR
jgi:hypothetical protein